MTDRRRIVTLANLLALLTLSGCAAAILFEERHIDAVYELDPTLRTLVIVEDNPTRGFGVPTVPNIIASRVMHELSQAEPYRSGDKTRFEFVNLAQLNNLMVREGNDYKKLTIFDIGRRLNAEQVIYVYVDSITNRGDGAMSRPTAHVQVKVIDIVNARRVFPDDSSETGYHPITIDMQYQHDSQMSHAAVAGLTQKLANMIGTDVAWLFFRHWPRTVRDPDGR